MFFHASASLCSRLASCFVFVLFFVLIRCRFLLCPLRCGTPSTDGVYTRMTWLHLHCIGRGVPVGFNKDSVGRLAPTINHRGYLNHRFFMRAKCRTRAHYSP